MKDIILTPLKLEDIELVRNWRNSEEVSKYMYTDSEISSEQQLNWFNRINNDPTCKYWMIEYENKKLGIANLTGINNALQSCYWAFYLGDLSVRGVGVGSKIEYNVLQYVFGELGLNKLRCEVFVSNESVISMHEKFGFRREAYYRQHCIKGSKKLDAVGLAILKDEWKNLEPYMKNKIYGNEH